MHGYLDQIGGIIRTDFGVFISILVFIGALTEVRMVLIVYHVL